MLDHRTYNAGKFSGYRKDFPILQRRLNGQPLIYLDSAATSLKPKPVIDSVCRFYKEYTANVHRAIHLLSEELRGKEIAKEFMIRPIGSN